MAYLMGEYDIIVIGAGHAAARRRLLGPNGKKNTDPFDDLEAIACSACNPFHRRTRKDILFGK